MPNQPQATNARSSAGMFAPEHAERRAAIHGKRNAVLRARVGVENHRHAARWRCRGRSSAPPATSSCPRRSATRPACTSECTPTSKSTTPRCLSFPTCGRLTRRRRDVRVPVRRMRDVVRDLVNAVGDADAVEFVDGGFIMLREQLGHFLVRFGTAIAVELPDVAHFANHVEVRGRRRRWRPCRAGLRQ